MKKQLGILLMHGAGKSTFKPQEKFAKKLRKRLVKLGSNVDAVEIHHVDWYTPLQNRQEEILARLERNIPRLKGKALRQFTISLVSDLVVYGGIPNKNSDVYSATHKLVHDSIVKMKNSLEEKAPLFIVASSMATEIINNYIWDRQNHQGKDEFGQSPFERFETLTGLFTIGSNLPIYAPSTDIDSLMPIRFPGNPLEDKYKNSAVWENIYDKNDPLGFPIKCLNENYKNGNFCDVHINVGGLFTSWNAASHLKYWSSGKLVKRIGSHADKVLKLMEG